MCDTITKNLGVVPSSDIQEWVPLDTVTNPAIPPEDPFDNLQDVMDPSLTADLGFLSASNQGLDKSLVNEQGLPAEEDLTDVFTGAPFESAHILNDDFINNLDFDDSDPSEFQDAGIGGCRNSVSCSLFRFSFQHLPSSQDFQNLLLRHLSFSPPLLPPPFFSDFETEEQEAAEER